MRPIAPMDELKRKIVLHVQQFPNYTLEVRPLSLTRDIPVLHKWVNMEYAKTFWQMDGSYKKLYHHYEQFLASGLGDSLMFFYQGNPMPVAQMDFYNPKLDEVGDKYEVQEDDIGVHLLMGPPINPVQGLTTHVMLCGISYLFISGAKRIIGEPDASNINANELVKRVGFQFVKPITLSYKTANLYFLEKTEFLKRW
ncbi:GNAT family N-acetyltransferase [Niabella hibiscisoli]|uniref:GNAT family N-acetyltransferase n=1 Tax=Niabella hibiscisoli TaxID=1825928 RepID=UPI001F0FAB1E|nr:GNAT family N-acetyltransferase [Niabella hibiscisoli]MCH5719932.1 acetyltransferase [Niabella hibiscisoli]